jgi:ArsR family transcriptional regulator
MKINYKNAHINFSNDEKLKQLARFAKALGHPTRLLIMQYLQQQNFCFTGELVDILPIAQSTVSQHLKELKEAGLIKGEVCAPKVKYCIDKDNWQMAKDLFYEFFDVKLDDNNC